MNLHRNLTAGLGVVLACALTGSSPVHAHIKLLQPASFLNEDELGGPQKGSPCGPGNTRPFLGDNKEPVPYSDSTSSFHAGETITVEWQETVYHPGYFRVAVAKVAAKNATTDDFPDPPLSQPDECLFDRAAVPTTPHDNVLADGLEMATEKNGEVRHISTQVKLPDEPCDSCTLQVVQVMEAHPAASCYYFHCADIKILPKGASAAADGGAAGGGAASSAGKPAANSGGCSVARAGAPAHDAAGLAWLLCAGAALLCRRRRPARAAPPAVTQK